MRCGRRRRRPTPPPQRPVSRPAGTDNRPTLRRKADRQPPAAPGRLPGHEATLPDAATVVAALAAFLPISSAGAAQQPTAHLVGPVVTAPGGETAYVAAQYRCYEETHLWVSAKQMDDGRQDQALLQEGSSGHADTWLQQHPTTLRCDGDNHVQVFTIDKTEVAPWSPEPIGKGALRRGWAYVQFCMTSENAFVYPNGWRHVL